MRVDKGMRCKAWRIVCGWRTQESKAVERRGGTRACSGAVAAGRQCGCLPRRSLQGQSCALELGEEGMGGNSEGHGDKMVEARGIQSARVPESIS